MLTTNHAEARASAIEDSYSETGAHHGSTRARPAGHRDPPDARASAALAPVSFGGGWAGRPADPDQDGGRVPPARRSGPEHGDDHADRRESAPGSRRGAEHARRNLKRERYFLTQADCDRLRRLCEIHTQADAAAIVGCIPNAVTAAKNRGWKAFGMPLRPRPSDFALRADEMTLVELARHYRTGRGCVARWAAEINRERLPNGGGVKPRPIPADLAEVVAMLGAERAAAHYGVNRKTLRKWRKAAGLSVEQCRAKKIESSSLIGWADRYAAERRGQSPKEKANG